MDNNISVENISNQRAQFLKVLCSLSFIGNIFYLVWTIWGYISIIKSEDFIKSITSSKDVTHGIVSEMEQSLLSAYENAVPNLVIGLLCSLICLYGALQIWKLKKIGFFIYSVGEITPAISAFFLAGGGLIGGAGAVIGLLFAVVWIVLYAVNLKHMK